MSLHIGHKNNDKTFDSLIHVEYEEHWDHSRAMIRDPQVLYSSLKWL